jgi:catechol 2,3-dioxygenase-like lactoylglutathione lyase family enzyme
MQAKLAYSIKFVADMDAAVAFYRDTFGLKVRMQTPFWSEFETGEVTLALHPASDDNPAGSVEIGFRTEGLPALYADRERQGLTFVQAPFEEHGTLLSTVLDCEGARVSLSAKP